MKNQKIITLLIAVFASSAILLSCEDFVQSVDQPIDTITPEQIQSESEIGFFVDGVVGRFHTTYDNALVLAGGLSDQLEFRGGNAGGPVNDATFPTFFDIDIGDIEIDNNSVDGVFFALGQSRFLADDLLRQANDIEFEDQALRERVFFTGNLYGGLSRYLYAVYFGLEEDRGGGVIDNGPFIPSSEMFGLALDKLNTALNFAPTDEETRIVNTMIGKIHLIQGNFSQALPFLESGMIPGDSFIAQYSQESQNAFDFRAGRSRNQYTVADRFKVFIDDDSTEANRIQLEQLPNSEVSDTNAVVFRQTKYGDATANINILTWQENNLMLAELAVRGENTTKDADVLINEVRSSHNISTITGPVDLDFIELERDKELYMEGNRLIDQRRFGTFHLAPNAWRYLPITQNERSENPNL